MSLEEDVVVSKLKEKFSPCSQEPCMCLTTSIQGDWPTWEEMLSKAMEEAGTSEFGLLFASSQTDAAVKANFKHLLKEHVLTARLDEVDAVFDQLGTKLGLSPNAPIKKLHTLLPVSCYAALAKYYLEGENQSIKNFMDNLL
ncbi:MAG: hypothetical protein S4CHLAM102_14460 [Chlamydiia bacterium]|nr:hypothetical protein [Chlamydiia bacterium]